MSNQQSRIEGFCLALLLLALLYWGGRAVGAQNIEHSPTRQWEVASFAIDGAYKPLRLEVVDTSSVCIYIARGWDSGAGQSPAITAVPKTQLNPGAGCQ